MLLALIIIGVCWLITLLAIVGANAVVRVRRAQKAAAKRAQKVVAIDRAKKKKGDHRYAE
jgi:hypothetical protein